MDRVFLDANVLFSAAYRPHAGILRLWHLQAVELVTSAYALEEARRNLDRADQRQRLSQLAASMEVVETYPTPAVGRGVAGQLDLPEKDVPILAAAVHTDATHLLTGDVKHFGGGFGKTVAGVLIQMPAEYLAARVSPDENVH